MNKKLSIIVVAILLTILLCSATLNEEKYGFVLVTTNNSAEASRQLINYQKNYNVVDVQMTDVATNNGINRINLLIKYKGK